MLGEAYNLKVTRRNWLVEQSREAEGIIPRSLLRNLFPKLALGFIPVVCAFATARTE